MATSNTGDFVHLHVHTEYSMLDGAARVGNLLDQAVEFGMPAVAMTDHGNLYGAYDFWSQATKRGIKPIIGLEGYYAPQGRFERSPHVFSRGRDDDGAGTEDNMGKSKAAYTHMTLLSENNVGMRNLFRLSSLSSFEGYYFKPRFDRELLQTYGAGLIGTTGCPSGEVNRWLQAGQSDKALQTAADMQDILGKENYFCELMDHGLEIENRTKPQLLEIAKKLNLPLLATNDLHYVHAHDADAHEVLLCIGTRTTMDDPKRFKFDARDFYLKPAHEMQQVWQDYPEAIANTLLVAERCEVSFATGADLMPQFPVPEGESEQSWLVKEVEAGLNRRFNGQISDEHRKRADYELDVIGRMGFPGYFLVTADLVAYANKVGIRVGPGRGSAAGSLVAYALGITELDPLKYGLLFERFLNPERVSMPDIDMDFDERRRGEMIRYATEKYGDEYVAQIVTYGSIKAKAAIKDAARALGFPYSVGDTITKAMPPAVMGKDIPLSGVFDKKHDRYHEAVELRQLYEQDPQVRQIIDTARGLEGLKRQPGVHAAGVIMSKEPLMDVIPLWRREQDGAVITQFDMGACESLGLLKMDFLGLRNLTVFDDALENIAANRGETVVLEELELADTPTFEMMSRGETLGVFQLDGGPMRTLLQSLRPDSFEDISAVMALYRPGPMGANAHNDYADRKNGRQRVTPIHPELAEPLAEILDETYGLIIYQEQVMAIAQKVAGYSLGQADLLRRAMGKKNKEILDKEFEPFSQGMRERGYSDEAIQVLWDILVPFSNYAFNKSHSAAYGMVSFWTGYLKANYPAEYMAALLTSVKDDKDKSALYLAECRRMGINVLPPDVNESASNYTPQGTDIRFGLSAIRNVGHNVVESLIQARTSQGAFTSFADFIEKVDSSVCNKRVLESLIKAGAFDSLDHTRQGLFEIHLEAADAAVERKRAEAIGQFDLFADFGAAEPEAPAMGETTPIPGTQEWSKSTLLAFEREMLGLYVSDHPLRGVEAALRQVTDCSVPQLLEDVPEGGRIAVIGGLVTSINRKVSRAGSNYAIITLEDLVASIEIMVFGKLYQEFELSLREDMVLAVKTRVEVRDEGSAPRAVALEIQVPDLELKPTGPVVLQLEMSRVIAPIVHQMREIFRNHAGATDVVLQLSEGATSTSVRLDPALRVTPSTALFSELKALLGPRCLADPVTAR